MIIDDISTAQFPEALKGVNAVIHTAAPLAYYVTDAEGQLKVRLRDPLSPQTLTGRLDII